MCTVERCLREHGVGALLQGGFACPTNEGYLENNRDGNNYAETLGQYLPVHADDQTNWRPRNIVRFATSTPLKRTSEKLQD